MSVICLNFFITNMHFSNRTIVPFTSPLQMLHFLLSANVFFAAGTNLKDGHLRHFKSKLHDSGGGGGGRQGRIGLQDF